MALLIYRGVRCSAESQLKVAQRNYAQTLTNQIVDCMKRNLWIIGTCLDTKCPARRLRVKLIARKRRQLHERSWFSPHASGRR